MATIAKHFCIYFLFLVLLSIPLLAGCGDDDDDDSGGGLPEDDDDTTDDDDAADDDATDDDSTDDDDDSTCEGCLIGSECYDEGDVNPDNDCQVCDVAAATDAWTDNDGAACDDGEYCNGADTCSGDVCDVHAGNPCNDDEVCEEPDACTPACFEDSDRDGFGDPESWQERDGDCPYGWVIDNTDCDPAVFLINPDAFDLPDDGIDQNCDGSDFVNSETDGIYVDGSVIDKAPACTGTIADPCGTITEGIAVAEIAGKTNLFVAKGTYVEQVETLTVSLFGGYDSSGWTRNIETNETVIESPDIYAVWVGALMDEKTAPVVVEGFIINGYDSGLTAAAVVLNDTNAQVIGNEIDGGTGTDLSSGFYVRYGTSLIAYNDILGGTGSYNANGALIVSGTHVWVGNTIDAGSATGKSYGVRNFYSNITLINNTIDGGSASGPLSAGVMDHEGTVLADGNTITVGTSYYSFGFESGNGDTTLIDNTIDGGTGDPYSWGVRLSQGEMYAKGNTITGAIAPVDQSKVTTYSWGIQALSADTTLVSNTIDGGENCSISRGVEIQNGDHTLKGNQVDAGAGTFSAYGIWSWQAANTTLINNTAKGGSGLFNYGAVLLGGTHDLIHNTLDGGNTYYTTGLYVGYDADADVINNIIAGGSGSTISQAARIYFTGPKALTIDFYGNDVWDSADCLLQYTDGSDTCLTTLGAVNALSWAGDNVSADPVFDADGFHLTSGSTSVIDMGVDYSSYYSGTLADTDYDGEDRPNGASPDIGADEYYANKK